MTRLTKLTGLFVAASLTLAAHDVVLTWDDFINGPAVKYRVYRAGGTCTGTFFKLTSPPVTPKTHTDVSVSPGPHCYAVTAVDVAGGESAFSNKVLVTVPVEPPTNNQGLIK